jgi:hypothetical protein
VNGMIVGHCRREGTADRKKQTQQNALFHRLSSFARPYRLVYGSLH